MNDVILGSVLSALSTGLGAIPILFMQQVTHRWRDILLAFTAGIMMAASTMSLIPEALQSGGIFQLTIGLFLGVATLTTLEKNIPHIDIEHAKKGIQVDRKTLLIVTALTLHNLPEGLSVGVSYASESNIDTGNLVAIAIGLQNAPEGFLVALFLVNQKINKLKALVIATLTGTVEIITSILGYTMTASITSLVPYGLSFAAGAMLFIIYKELIPESHGDGNERYATYSFILGLLFMITLLQLFE